MHTTLPASSLHSPCVRAHQLPLTNTMFFIPCGQELMQPLYITVTLFLFFCIYSLWPPFSSPSILFSLTLFQSFFLSGSKDVRHSSVWFVLPSPSASLLLPPFLLSSFTEKEGGRRRVEEGGCKGDVLSASVLFCVCGVAKISTEYKKKWKDMWGSLYAGEENDRLGQGQHAQTVRKLMISVFANSKEVWNLKTNSGLEGMHGSTNNYSAIPIM